MRTAKTTPYNTHKFARSMARSLHAEVNTLNSSTRRLLDELLKASPPRVQLPKAPSAPANVSGPVGGTPPAKPSSPAVAPSGPVGGKAPALNRPQRRIVGQQVESGSKGNQRMEGSVETGPLPARRAAAPVAAPVAAQPQESNSTSLALGATAWASYNAALGNDNKGEKEPALQVGVAGGAAAPMISGVTSAIQPRLGKSLFSGSWFNSKILLD